MGIVHFALVLISICSCSVLVYPILIDYFLYKTLLHIHLDTSLKTLPLVIVGFPAHIVTQDMNGSVNCTLLNVLQDDSSLPLKIVHRQWDTDNVYFTFSAHHLLTGEEQLEARTKFKIQILLSTDLKTLKRFPVTLLLHSRKIHSTYENHYYRTRYRNGIHLKFKRIAMSLLSSPYETHCRNYSEEGLRSQDHCLTLCILSETRKLCNLTPSCVLRDKVDQSHTDDYWPCFDSYQILPLCERRCGRIDCQLERYDISFSYFDSSQKGIHVYMSQNDANITYTFHPKLTLLNVVIFIGAALTMCTGFNLYTFALWPIQKYTKSNFVLDIKLRIAIIREVKYQMSKRKYDTFIIASNSL